MGKREADVMVALIILALAFWDTLENVTRPLAGARKDLEVRVNPGGRVSCWEISRFGLRALTDGIHARHGISDGKRPNQLPNAEGQCERIPE
ncbi:hypothetical protein BDP55DRAFT_272377 [Colletotrichum godetiae]|uniref:Uncharacterized protein n=1 Tax=Colletotrichum godetiae TaxID=1209918 RepID=A0AAJ0EPW9_9PEZI|nr:uncharacterized protein BDP55DRAFT_272377 [Colletotrichum godetiae]KAK1672141.1 hypothetical protein BDP55DRAFT_272377 [Colletotrichum godetiae]